MRLENMINMEHEVVLLFEKINWKAFEKKFGEVYIQNVGHPITSLVFAYFKLNDKNQACN